MTKMQKLVLLMTFWFAPGGVIKEDMWTDFTGGKPFDEETLFTVIAFVINGIDDKFVNWPVMDVFIEDMNAKSGIVVDQVATPPVVAEPTHTDEAVIDPAVAPVAKTPRKRKPAKKDA